MGKQTELRTKKAARAAGYVGEKELSDFTARKIPKHGAEPVVIKGEPFFAPDDCEPLLNKTDARSSGLRIPNGVEPVVWKSWKYGVYGLWRRSDLMPVAKRTSKPPETIDLLAAIFVVNRSAKRYRDKASSCYSSGAHSFAKAAKQTKEWLYKLKDCGIAEAYHQGRLTFAGRNGTLALYRGEDYAFHSKLLPPGQSADLNECETPVFIDAKPKHSKEGRLKDAVHTLEPLPQPDGFTILTVPAPAKAPRYHSWHDDDEEYFDDDECYEEGYW